MPLRCSSALPTLEAAVHLPCPAAWVSLTSPRISLSTIQGACAWARPEATSRKQPVPPFTPWALCYKACFPSWPSTVLSMLSVVPLASGKHHSVIQQASARCPGALGRWWEGSLPVSRGTRTGRRGRSQPPWGDVQVCTPQAPPHQVVTIPAHL